MFEEPVGANRRSLLGWGNRGWMEIVSSVLEVCERGALKTHIMYKCNLNSRQVQDYLDMLVRSKLVEPLKEPETVNRKTHYITARRGQDFLRSYRLMYDIFRETSFALDEAEKTRQERSTDQPES